MEENKVDRRAQLEFFDMLVGKECWSRKAGAGTGSMVSFDLGKKIRRTNPVRNPMLSEDQLNFIGEFGLFIMSAKWHVMNESGIICDSGDNNSPNGPMLVGLDRLVGKLVVSWDFVDELFGFELNFNDGISLVVTCPEGCLLNDCYSFHQP